VQAAWDERFAAYETAFPELAAEFVRRMAGELPADFAEIAVDAVGDAHDKAETVASRKASQIALGHFTARLPELLGGSADLTGSNLTNTPSTPAFRVDEAGAVVKTEAGQIGRHINYGVREFGMAAIMNGVALHGGYIPYGGTFLTFSDYSRNAIRMAALMKQRVIHVFTHDSIGLGEDGPTHQSVEHAASLRLIPGLDVWRPADTTETAVAWTIALANKHRPSALLLAPEPALPAQDRRRRDHPRRLRAVRAQRGRPEEGGQAVIIATGSEVQLALRAQEELAEEDPGARGLHALDHRVRPPGPGLQEGRAAAQAAAHRRRGRRDRLLVEVRLRRRGGHRPLRRIRPAGELFKHFGFTAENVALTVRKVLAK
jgi:transketolase